jgi:hypothetical protein
MRQAMTVRPLMREHYIARLNEVLRELRHAAAYANDFAILRLLNIIPELQVQLRGQWLPTRYRYRPGHAAIAMPAELYRPAHHRHE